MKIKLCILLALQMSACKNFSANSPNNDAINVTKHRILKEKHSLDSNWNCYDVQYDKICCPAEWKIVKQNEVLFFTKLDDSLQNTFFTVVRHDKGIIGLNLDGYLEGVYKQLREDSVERFIEYRLQELEFQDGKAFYGEFYTKYKGLDYVSFTMYTEKNEMLYDFTLKVSKNDSDRYYEVFKNILYSYRANDECIFCEDKEIKSIRTINIDQ